jgi:ABC-type sugar transport system, periplasmic component
MASDNREDGISRRHALECMVWVGTAVLWMVSGGVPQSLSLLDGAQAAVAIAQTKPTIPVIVKDTTSLYWQTVLAGARKAGQDFGVEIAELGAQSESDADGQIALLENASHRTRRRSSSRLRILPPSANRLMKPPRE